MLLVSDTWCCRFRAALKTTLQARADEAGTACNEIALNLHLSDLPNENYFYSDCHSATQIVVTSPLSDSNLCIYHRASSVGMLPYNAHDYRLHGQQVIMG